MDFSRKRTLINELIEIIKKLEYKDYSSQLPDFMSEGEVVLEKIFGAESKHIKKFQQVHFRPMAIGLGRDNTDIYIKRFNSGKTDMISVLNGALKELDLEEEFSSTVELTEPIKSNKVFIVHGHDDGLKIEVARFVEKLGFEAIILHEQVNVGNTIIEKIERHSEVGFAIVLYTPCDEGKSKRSDKLRDRARQNVVFEHGYFIAKLGRSNVVALHKGDDIELPNDISGVVYVKYENTNWKREIADEMDASGYNIDYKLVR